MADETAPESLALEPIIDPVVIPATPYFTLVSVLSVTASAEPGVYSVDAVVCVASKPEEQISVRHGLRPEDDSPVGAVIRQWMQDHDGEFEIAPHVAPPPVPYSIPKTTPWLRMTDNEAATMEAAMNAASARLRQIYNAATYLNSGDELWPMLRQIIVDNLGEARADQLLAQV